MAALSIEEDRIKSLFVTKEVNPAGIYVVNFIINGENKTVTIDDYFPYDTNIQGPAFSQTKGNELWVLILEKAWAKLNGNYENTISGLTQDALSFLLPAPSYVIDHKFTKLDDDKIWQMMLYFDKRGHIICGSSQNQEEKKDLSERGIVSLHAYTISDIVEINAPKDGKVKLVRMRNPWGHHEWDGDWSDKSEKWTPSLRKKLDYYEEDDGEFFICFKDYLSYYGNTSITHYEPHYEWASMTVKQPKSSYNYIELEIDTDTHFYISFQQINARLMQKPYRNLKPSQSRIIVGRETGVNDEGQKQFEYISGEYSYDTTLVWNSDQSVDPGNYVVFVEFEWSAESKHHEFIVSLYSENPIKMSVGPTAGHNQDFLASVLKSCAKKKTEKHTYTENNQPDVHRYMSITDANCDYGYVYYENNSESVTLEEKVDLSEMEGFELRFPHQGKSVEVKLGPGQNEIAILKRVADDTKFSCSFYTSFKDDNLDYGKEAISKGEKNTISADGKDYQVYFYALNYDEGYVFHFVNQETDKKFDGTFQFELTNLKIRPDDNQDGPKAPNPNSWVVSLYPGETVTKFLDIDQKFEQYGYSYSFGIEISASSAPKPKPKPKPKTQKKIKQKPKPNPESKIKTKNMSESQLIDLVMKNGKKRNLKNYQTDNVYYYLYSLDNVYHFVFDNQYENK